jgi:hypothetical protein
MYTNGIAVSNDVSCDGIRNGVGKLYIDSIRELKLHKGARGSMVFLSGGQNTIRARGK